MDVTDLTIRILLLFLPGITCHFLVDALTVHRERKPYQVLLLAYVYAVMCYLLYAMVYWIFALVCKVIPIGIVLSEDISFLRSLTNSKVEPSYLEIGFVTIVAVVLAFLLSYAWNHHWLYSVARRLKVTQKFGQANVWSFALNLEEVKWAVVRDIENGFMFEGYIRAYSDIEETQELLLTDVVVYNESTGEELYRTDRLYVSRDKKSLTVEFPTPPAN